MNEIEQTETTIDRTEADAPVQQQQLDAEWLQSQWETMADDETLEVTVGGLKRFLADRLHEALSSQLSASDGEDDE